MSENRAEIQTQIYPLSGWRKVWSDYSESTLAVAALFVFSSILFIAIFAPFVSPTNPYEPSLFEIMWSTRSPNFLGSLSGSLTTRRTGFLVNLALMHVSQSGL